MHNRCHGHTNAVLKHHRKTRLALVETQTAEMGLEIETLIGANENTSRQRDMRASNPRLGQHATTAILTLLLKIWTPERRYIDSPAGPVPYNRDRREAGGKANHSSAAGVNLCETRTTFQLSSPCV